MRRREFIGRLAGAAAAWPLSVHAQQPARMRHISIWIGRPEDAEAVRLAASVRQRLQVLGWTEGRNIRTDYRWVVADIDRGPAVAKEIIDQKPEVILADSTPAVAALMRENSGVPIVFVNVSDPLGSGFIANLSRPGGMITGFISNEPTLGAKWLQLLKEIAPGMRHAGLIFNPDTAPYANAFLREADTAARLLKVGLSAMRAQDAFEIEQAISTLGSEPSGGLWCREVASEFCTGR